MVQLTGRLADGWSISASRLGPEEILRSQQTIDEAAHSAGRDPSAIIRNHNLAGIVQSPGKLAAAPQQNGLLVGEVGHWVEELVRMAQDLHMNSFTFSPCADEREAQVRLFAEEVVPAVREHLCLR